MDRVFPHGVIMMDFDKHRMQRRTLSVTFKSGPMKACLAALNEGIAERVAHWRVTSGPMLFHPAMKRLTLDLAATSVLGGRIGPEIAGLARAFVSMAAATVAPVHRPLPGTQMRLGVRGRAHA